MPRVLYVVSDGAFFVSHRMPIALAAKAAGYTVGVAAPRDKAVSQYIESGFDFLEVPFSRGGFLLYRECKALRKTYGAIKRYRPDVVHLITAKPIIYGGLVCRLRGVSAIAAIPGLGHILSHENLQTRAIRRLVLWAFRAAIDSQKNHVIFQNKDDIRVFVENKILLRASHSLIAGCGVDLEKIQPAALPVGNPVMLLPARMTRNKGVGEFVEVARMFRKKGIPGTFRLLGNPDYGNPTAVSEAELKKWSDEPNIEWRPYTSQISRELAEAHVVVLPSYREGFPKTLIDAAAAGRACAATDVPGNRDAVIDGVTGRLFRAKDPVAMADVLERIVLNRRLLGEMGRAAREHAEEFFCLGDVCRKHLEIYEDVIRR